MKTKDSVKAVWLYVMRDCKFYYSAAYASRGVSRELNMAADSWQIRQCLQFYSKLVGADFPFRLQRFSRLSRVYVVFIRVLGK